MMTLQKPMLQDTDAPAPIAEAVVVTPDVLEPKSTSLRRAATALLIFGMICSRPCPSSWGAWLAVMAAVSVLCSSSDKIVCRSRCARFAAFLVALFASYAVVSLVLSLRAGMPQQISAAVHGRCVEMPEETFAWAKNELVERKYLRHGLLYLSRQTSNDTTLESAPSHPAELQVGALEPEQWSQSEACHCLSRFVACVAKMMVIGSALAHLFLFFSAVAVLKSACRLRCAAYRAGLLKWQCGASCKSACKRAADPSEPVQASKEMA